ncbi:MAG: transglycosylase domain-containing protein [Gammaproteobacteria bacterium]|nr:transglycosylase domain-containing protein [Gammaproteobacteria bacterium]MBU1442102.1 transglycosylase domain-containing protein [Gammaproteobacteria bacterium]
MKTTLRYLLFAFLALALTACAAIYLVLRLALAPGPDEWPARVKVGPVSLDVGVPTALRLATSTWFAPWIDGHSLDTRYGTVHFAWDAPGTTLALRCAPCTASVPSLSSQPIRLEQLRLTARRDAATLAGTIEVSSAADAPADDTLRARWNGRLSQKDLHVSIDADEAPIARWYAALSPRLPELQQARIGGTMALRAQITLPAGSFAVQPRISDFTVEGLGTEAMLNARSACGAPSRLTTESLLARAVVAAEDQRFYQHPGYDLAELMASLDLNQKAGRVERGASTLTQQLARLIVTGGERTAERKLRELLYAVEMEQTLGKARILQLYLDNAPWGSGVCGAEAAARHYFKRSARVLDLPQSVWLAALLTNPDAAVDQWKREGKLDPARLKAVIEGLRGISRQQREQLSARLADNRFAPN